MSIEERLSLVCAHFLSSQFLPLLGERHHGGLYPEEIVIFSEEGSGLVSGSALAAGFCRLSWPFTHRWLAPKPLSPKKSQPQSDSLPSIVSTFCAIFMFCFPVTIIAARLPRKIAIGVSGHDGKRKTPAMGCSTAGGFNPSHQTTHRTRDPNHHLVWRV